MFRLCARVARGTALTRRFFLCSICLPIEAEGKQMPIAVDSETFLIVPGCLAPPLVCISTSRGELWHGNDAETRDRLVALLQTEVIVGHNIAFDMAVFAAKWPELLPLIFEAYQADRITDTMLREKLSHIALGVYRGYFNPDGSAVKYLYSLADVAKRRLNRDLDKTTWRTGYAELVHLPLAAWPDGARQYAIDDAVTTFDVWQSQENDAARLLRDQYRQARAAWWLHLTSAWGLKTDPAGVRRFKEQVEAELADARDICISAGIVRKNGTRDTKAAAKIMQAACRAANMPVPTTEKGAVKLDRGSCEKLDHPVLSAYARLSSLGKQLSTDLPLLESGATKPVQARFETLLETGRTSSSPNIQNLPRKGGMRECFVPRAGYVFAAADYEQMELRTVAQVCLAMFRQSRLAKALNDGIDPHLEMAARILNIPYDEALKRKKAGDSDVDNARQTAKVANFGFPGGLGIARFCDYAKNSYGVTISENEAANLKKTWLASWPEFQQYFNWIANICEQQLNPTVEQLYVERYRGGVSFTEACNSMFQGLAADAAKNAGFLIAKACYIETDSPLFGSRIVNFVHDEIIIETPEEKAHEAAMELARLMVDGASVLMPDVPPKVEPLLMRRWSKKAKPLHDEQERLVPWDG